MTAVRDALDLDRCGGFYRAVVANATTPPPGMGRRWREHHVNRQCELDHGHGGVCGPLPG